MSTPTRAQWIADARAVLDLLESNPALPLNLVSGVTVGYYPLGDVGDIEAMAAVDAVADILGVAVTPAGPGSHYEAEICFGSASYKAIAVLKDYRDRRAAIDRLGEAALDADAATEAFVDAADAERYAQRDDYVNSDEGEAEPASVFAADDLVNICDPDHKLFGTRGVVVGSLYPDGVVVEYDNHGNTVTVTAAQLMHHTEFVKLPDEFFAAAARDTESGS